MTTRPFPSGALAIPRERRLLSSKRSYVLRRAQSSPTVLLRGTGLRLVAFASCTRLPHRPPYPLRGSCWTSFCSWMVQSPFPGRAGGGGFAHPSPSVPHYLSNYRPVPSVLDTRVVPIQPWKRGHGRASNDGQTHLIIEGFGRTKSLRCAVCRVQGAGSGLELPGMP